MRFGIALLVTAAMYAQGGWKEFTLGPPTRNQARFGPDGIRAAGVPLKRVLSRAYGLPEHRILGPSWIAEERYALTAVPANPDDLQTLLQQELTNQFHMIAHREKRAVEVLVLKKMEGASESTPLKPVSGKPTVEATMSTGSLRLPQATLKSFAASLADMIVRPVFDETEMDSVFDINLTFQQGNIASLRKAVRDQLGLELADDRRVVDLVQIDHIEKPKFQ